ncbi:chromatin target of PRMT1b [Trichomycterus rosablanca]|uniref:chromatin target of PRMT1b n=1 Tax=Trichomycterus rosablanca TaxID=2290929 RepID=UPI002F350FEB
MNSPFSPILLKSTSSMSLHDRFTYMLQNKQPLLVDIDNSMPQVQAASLQNQHLAQQLANRPSVLAALQNRSNLKQRLGKRNVKARLGRPVMRGDFHGTTGFWGKPRGRGTLLRNLPQKGMSRLHVSGLVVHGGLISPQESVYRSGEQVLQSRRYTGAMRGRGRGWAAGRGRAEGRPLPTREQLDEQLDDYMSMTKSHLDAQLDEYMAEVDSEDVL